MFEVFHFKNWGKKKWFNCFLKGLMFGGAETEHDV